MNFKEEPPEIGFHSVSELGSQAIGVKIKVETFPCDTTGCNIKEQREDLEPEHTLQCLLVRALQESENTNTHIEQICTILSKRYKYFYNIPPYILVGMIKDLIETEPMVKGLTIILNEDDHCVLLSCDAEASSLEYVKQEIKLEHDTLDIRADSPNLESLMFDLADGGGELKYESSVDIETGTCIYLLLRTCYKVMVG